MPWQSDANVGEQAAEWLLTRIGDTDTPVVQGMRLVFVANRHIDLADESYNNDLGAKVEIKDSRTGIDSTGSGEYWKLHKVTKQYIHNTLLKVTYLLKFIEPDGTFWRLGATASDDLGVDTKLGYF